MNGPFGETLPAGPILVVADNEAITRGGPAWAQAFAAADRVYRVRLAGPSSPRAIAAEAHSLGASAILWAGGPDVCDLATLVATDLAIAVFNAEILNHARLS